MKIDSSISIPKIMSSESVKVNNVKMDKEKVNSEKLTLEKSKEVVNKNSKENDNIDMHRKEEDAELFAKAVEKANKVLFGYNRKIEREVHEKTKTMIYKIKDTETDEVIKEFPPEKIQDMIAKMWELVGLFVDEKA